MAKQHFLQASFTGSIGTVTGQRLKGQNVVKLKKYVKCHNGEKSNNACKAFTCLHRVSCKVAPSLQESILTKVKKSELIPKLEGMWKDWIKNQQFPWDGIKNVAPQILPYSINNLSYNEFSFTANFTVSQAVVLPPSKKCVMFFFIHNEVGQVFAVHFFPYSNNEINIQLAGVVEHQLYLSSILLVQENKKWTFQSPSAHPLYIWAP